ncbi:PREDICTED: LOW QUALITY PROTEIN: uncharacterized protein LOC104807956 [Tarenaya hassleriana]|uniref:LOW QUALITY PROTEIN: uncharacterized protein LOC104807956 n=1 Tax=Tarenaya hassleriana TaxID=28532 RepID=UPI00053C7B5D|nr:PREDICTED: LOW QUALITY PROTEIN: uncharacterized protein LOC104807956 [Tarenaya hassleriana]
MGCLVLPVEKLRRLSTGSRFAYRNLTGDMSMEDPVKVVVGKERREFLVEPFVLEESPFRFLMGPVKERTKNRFNRSKGVLFLYHVDSILFEHLLWLLRNDLSSFSKIDLVDIIDFYSQD